MVTVAFLKLVGLRQMNKEACTLLKAGKCDRKLIFCFFFLNLCRWYIYKTRLFFQFISTIIYFPGMVITFVYLFTLKRIKDKKMFKSIHKSTLPYTNRNSECQTSQYFVRFLERYVKVNKILLYLMK